MKPDFIRSIGSLLSYKNGKIRGAMSPVLFAQETMKAMGNKWSGLARVDFEDERILQRREDGGLTGFDHLLISANYEDGTRSIYFFCDAGVHGLPIAFASSKENNGKIHIPEIYLIEKRQYVAVPTDEQIQQLFDYAFANFETVFHVPNLDKQNIQP